MNIPTIYGHPDSLKLYPLIYVIKILQREEKGNSNLKHLGRKNEGEGEDKKRDFLSYIRVCRQQVACEDGEGELPPRRVIMSLIDQQMSQKRHRKEYSTV